MVRSLKLSHKAMLLVGIPLLLEILLIAALLSIVVPFESVLKRAAKDYSVTLALNNLRNDVVLLEGIMSSSIKSKNYASPDWILKWTKDRNQTPAMPNRRGVPEALLKESWALANEQPQQLLGLPVQEFRYWSGQAKEHIKDLRAAAKGDPSYLERIDNFERLLHHLTEMVAGGRQFLRAKDLTKAIYYTAEAQLTVRQFEFAVDEHLRADALRQENLRQSPTGLDEQKLETRGAVFGRILLIGLSVNLLAAVSLALLFGRETKARLACVMENMERLSKGADLRPLLSGNDELSALDASFQDMAKVLSVAKRKERAIADNASEIICGLDSEDRLIQVNPASARIWGVSPEQLMNRDVTSIMPVEERNSMKIRLRELKETAQSMSFENNVVRSDGVLVNMQWSARWSDNDGLMLCIARDITKQREVERMKEAFIGMISSDLRKPLSVLQSFLGNLSQGKYGDLNDRGKDKTEQCSRSNSRLLGLVNDLLDVERLGSGKMDLNLTEQSSAELIKRSIDSVQGFAEQKAVRLAQIGQNHVCVADGDRIVQVLVNLIGNAVKFSPKDSTITCSADALNDFVEFRVKDEGRGIPEELCKSIFERFEQVSRTDATEKGGTGLGLAICKTIVENHRGEIGVVSQEGKGSTFWFSIPRTPLRTQDDS